MLSALELKIPPVILTLLFAGSMWLVTRLVPPTPIEPGFRIAIVLMLGTTAVLIGLAAVAAFRKADTTVNPLTPDACSSLVKTGVFRYTRNPMYLALFLALAAWGFFLQSFYALALCVIYVMYLNRFQIVPEERALEEVFGDEFVAYMNEVHRWL